MATNDVDFKFTWKILSWPEQEEGFLTKLFDPDRLGFPLDPDEKITSERIRRALESPQFRDEFRRNLNEIVEETARKIFREALEKGFTAIELEPTP